jgi:single-stranded-DNA-specific exonuclease
VTTTVAEWLRRQGHDDSEATRRYLEPKLAHLSDPGAMVDRNAAAERLARAVRKREKVAVFGDYDCDGITSAAIMTEALRILGADVVPLLASRFDGGYGVSEAACRRIIETRATLLVTCDCGSSDHASLERLQKQGIEVVVIDHHLVPTEPLPAIAFLNPHRPDCGFAYKGLASCGLALSLVAAVRASLAAKLDIRQWLDLVAIGTIADVAPLDGDNRALVRAGLAHVASRARPGLRALSVLAKIEGAGPLSGRDIAFRIAPRLNAPGRLGAPDAALELLMARTDADADRLASVVEALSVERRALQETMSREAIEEIEQGGFGERPAIVVGREGWNAGIVGIVAGRLAERFGRPVIVIGFESGHGRGSVRGPKGSRLHELLTEAANVLERFGGHQAAAGLEVRIEKLTALRDAFEAAVVRQGLAAAVEPFGEAIHLAEGDEPHRVIADIERLEPCGQGNPLPRLILEGIAIEPRELRGGHLRFDLAVLGRKVSCFGIGMGARAASLGGNLVVIGELRRDTYRGGEAVEILLDRVLA